MTDSTQQAAPAHSSARRTAREPHAVSDRADVPIVAAAIPRQTDIATSTLAYGHDRVSVAADYQPRRSKYLVLPTRAPLKAARRGGSLPVAVKRVPR